MMHAFPRTFSLPQSRKERVLPATFPPLTAAGYLRLRREAAGLKVADVARALARKPEDVATAIELVQMLEQPGNVARKHETLYALQRIFPFDQEVYGQLAREPADRHPHVCRGCGCSDWDTDDTHAVRFAWATPNACVRCVGPAEEDA